MTTTMTREHEQALGAVLGAGELPELTTVDRLALRVGVALILRGRRHAEQQERAEHVRRSRAGDTAAQARESTFENRHQVGPRW